MSNGRMEPRFDRGGASLRQEVEPAFVVDRLPRRVPGEFSGEGDKSITLRVSSELLDAVQSEAKRRRTNYQRLIREAIERFLTKAA